VNNSSQQRCFFARKAFALQNRQNLGWNYFALTLLALTAKTSYALPAPKPRIVLAVFARSCSADGKPKSFREVDTPTSC
jgi:hypothetical protein